MNLLSNTLTNNNDTFLPNMPPGASNVSAAWLTRDYCTSKCLYGCRLHMYIVRRTARADRGHSIQLVCKYITESEQHSWYLKTKAHPPREVSHRHHPFIVWRHLTSPEPHCIHIRARSWQHLPPGTKWPFSSALSTAKYEVHTFAYFYDI